MGLFGSKREEVSTTSNGGIDSAGSIGSASGGSTAPAPANTNAASAVAAEEYDVISEGLLRDIARLKGRAPVEGVPVLASVLYPVSAAIAAEERRKEEEALKNPQIGDQMADGSVFAGLTPDGKQQIYVMPKDLDVTMTFNDAAKRVAQLNANNADEALGHNDWQIPSLENLRVLYKNQNEGKLKGTFTTAAGSGSGYPDWYWSSTEVRDSPSFVHLVRFSDGYELWSHKGYDRLSCRPVRLVQVATP